MKTSIDLSGKVVLVAGGTGAVGGGIVKAFIEAGAQVLVPSRTPEKGETLRAETGAAESRLTILNGDVGNTEDAARIRQQILTDFGKLDAVVAALGGWWQGSPLTGVSLETWNKILQNNLTVHFIAAKTFVPALMQNGGSYTLIGGFSAELAVVGAGPICVAGAGQMMLAKMLAEENKDAGVRVNQLILGPIFSRARTKGKPEWLTAEEVGQTCVYLASEAGRSVSGSVIHLLERPPLKNQ